ncbi:MAG TPA: MBL fold metallo-hydrolase [Chthoniobacterales bacterium]|nr:MBL fold metallo-hydrolase [Chthoniobacterales bacterium]
MQHLNKTYQIGGATVTRIDEIPLPNVDPSVLYPDLEAGALERYGRFLGDGSYDGNAGTLTESIHTWLVRFSGYTMLVDTGVGNSKTLPATPQFGHLDLPYLDRLLAAGVQPEMVDFVLLTHVHMDHVGWNTRFEDGRWLPTFPNAKYIFSRTEQRYNASLSGHKPAPDLPPPTLGKPVRQPAPNVYDQSVAPIIESGLAELIDVGGAEFLDGISFLPTPGHSVDHASIRLRSGGQEALFLGDVMHHPLQVHRPDLRSVYCEFPEASQASREWILSYASENHALCFTSHFAESSAGYVSRGTEGFQWQFA